MVQAVENWADIEGVVASLQPPEAGATMLVAQVDVDRVESVEGYPNLVTGAAGTRLEVRVKQPAAEAAELAVGQRVACRVQRISPFATVAHPHHLRRL